MRLTQALASTAALAFAVLSTSAALAEPPQPLPNGSACDVAGSCQSGFCADQVCCDTACDTGCNVCSKAKGGATDGTCSALTCMVSDSECQTAASCDEASRSCTFTAVADGTDCSGGQCRSGACVPKTIALNGVGGGGDGGSGGGTSKDTGGCSVSAAPASSGGVALGLAGITLIGAALMRRRRA